MTNWLWDRNITEEEAKKGLANPEGADFIELASLLLSRDGIPEEVFSHYLSRESFVTHWVRIKRRMRTNSWNDPRIIFWQAIYDYLKKKFKKSGIRLREEKVVPDRFLKELGDMFRASRKKMGLTQKELAERLNIAQQVISRLERGASNSSIKTLQRIARALGAELRTTLSFGPD
ncbi:MAG: helix-turn-helix transcriptional regulator [Candidatus Omnitrophota bacterium]